MSDNKTVEEGMDFPPFIKHGEDIAHDITGEGPSGDQMILGGDVMVYFKMMGFEQGVLNRLRTFSDQNLAHDIGAGKGFLYLGELEAVKADLHLQIDNMFAAIAAHRKQESEKADEKSTQAGN